MKNITILDTFLQEEVPHNAYVDNNGEIVLENPETGHFVKFPAGTSSKELEALIARHNESNLGQVSAAQVEEEKAASESALEDIAEEN